VSQPAPPPPRIRYRIELLDGDVLVKSISVRGYRPTALREAARICAQPTLFESWVLTVSAYQLRRIRDDKVFDRTDVHINEKELKQ
jgi:hypothetical protein